MSCWMVDFEAWFLPGKHICFYLYHNPADYSIDMQAEEQPNNHEAFMCSSTNLLESKVHMKSALLVAFQLGLACEVVIFELFYYKCHICTQNNMKY